MNGEVSESNIKYFGGESVASEAYKKFIFKIDIAGDRDLDFAMLKESVFYLMGGEKEEKVSMDPDHPEEEGLIHFYQAANEDGEKQWKFLTPD